MLFSKQNAIEFDMNSYCGEAIRGPGDAFLVSSAAVNIRCIQLKASSNNEKDKTHFGCICETNNADYTHLHVISGYPLLTVTLDCF
jgi:hypothetical protein